MILPLAVGQIRHAMVPFTDDPSQAKYRPVVVLGWSKTGPGQDEVILVAPVTSFDGTPKVRDGDVKLDWQACGLTKPSWVRARRLWGADPKAVKDEKTVSSISTSELALIYLEIETLISAGL